MNKFAILATVIVLVSSIGFVALRVSDTKSHGGEKGAQNESALAGTRWEWTETVMSDGTRTTPKMAGAFTIAFDPEDMPGNIAITTDCNSARGPYTVGENNSLTFGPFATTLMACENSQEEEFMRRMNGVNAYLFKDEKLHLQIKYDSGSISFRAL